MNQQKEKKKSTFWKDFKAFIARGNIVDLAVAVVVGAAFTAIVNSLVNDIIKPLIALLVDGDFSELIFVLREETADAQAITLNYGNFIMAILTFLIDALVIFTVLRVVRKAKKRVEEGAEAIKEKLLKKEEKESNDNPAQETIAESVLPQVSSTDKLLEEIRDLLKEQTMVGDDKNSDK